MSGSADDTKPRMRHVKFPYGYDTSPVGPSTPGYTGTDADRHIGNGFFWPSSDQKRAEWLETKRMRPMVAQSVYQCQPGARQGVVFLDSDFAYYAPPAGLQRGLESPDVRAFCQRGETVIQAWDTAFSAESTSDYSVCVTALLMPSESYHRGEDVSLMGDCDPHYVVVILDVFRDRLSYHGLVPAARELNRRWQPGTIVIEKKAYGVPLVENLQNAGLNILPVVPVEGKRARAVEGKGAGSVQGWFRQHRVLLPSVPDEWLPAYLTEMKDFTGERGGRDDQVDATVHLVQYAIATGGSGVRMSSGWETPDEVDRQMAMPSMTDNAPMSEMMGHNGGPQLGGDFGLDDDPFDGMCGRCKHMDRARSLCRLHKFPVSELHGCYDFVAPNRDLSTFPRH